MKKWLLGAAKVLLWPLIFCHDVIRDAPILDCDNALVGFGEYRDHSEPAKPKIQHSHPSGVWVCRAR